MKNLDLEKMSQINGGKMFDYSHDCGTCIDGTQDCTNVLTVFWIPITQDYTIGC